MLTGYLLTVIAFAGLTGPFIASGYKTRANAALFVGCCFVWPWIAYLASKREP